MRGSPTGICSEIFALSDMCMEGNPINLAAGIAKFAAL
jgi:hypothetical protein